MFDKVCDIYSSVLEKNVKSLMESVDEMSQDANKFFNYQRQLIRQQQAKQQFTAKRVSFCAFKFNL